MPELYKRICITRCGYAIVPADTDEEALKKACELNASDFDWEPVNYNMIKDSAEVIETVNEVGESVG